MSTSRGTCSNLDRRKFLQVAGGSLGAGLLASAAGAAPTGQAVTPESIAHASASPPMSEKEKLVRIASNTYPIRSIFKTRTRVGDEDLTNCIASYKEMAEYGAGVGVKVTLENHWGLTANPINMRIIIEEVNNPFCEASPDFCNWENKYLLYHALQDLAPYAHTTVHAKFWDRFGEPDVQRNVRIMLNNNFTGVFALEYEAGPWDGAEGAQHLFQEVLAAM